ncbi:hypothetical protein DY000_02061985 [Brassica cretica]|uniref:Uncharacterized protein n=1 Tax=Brassica cretica TaxID=69181 RepID=A0ABQ7B1S5_BRACR|nr:hypothetical protein DY000_02061985 [Brassica cretica]
MGDKSNQTDAREVLLPKKRDATRNQNPYRAIEPIANSRARGGVVEVAEIVEQETEISEQLRRSRSRHTIKEEEGTRRGTR